MPAIAVSARSGAPSETAADTRVVPLFEGEKLDEPHLQALVDLGEAKPGLKKVALEHEDAPGGGRRRVLIAGLGKRDELDAEKARVAAAVVAGRAKELGAVSLSWASPDGVADALVEGTLLSLYTFDRFKSKPETRTTTGGIESLEIAGEGVDATRWRTRPPPPSRRTPRATCRTSRPTWPIPPFSPRARRRSPPSTTRWSSRCWIATRSSRAAWARSRRWRRAATPSRG